MNTTGKFVVNVYCLGMKAAPHRFNTREEADKFIREIRLVPGMVPELEEKK